MCIFFGTFEVKQVEQGWHAVTTATDSPSDGMYQPIQHPAIFTDKVDAEAFMEKVKHNRSKVNLANWIIGNHPCDAWQRSPENNPAMYVVNPVKY